jgi:hypothetical protein
VRWNREDRGQRQLVEALVREYKGGIRAVDGIDLEVAPGEIYGFSALGLVAAPGVFAVTGLRRAERGE